MSTGDKFGYYIYASDNTLNYVVKLSAKTAAAGGFAATSAPSPLSLGVVWPYGAHNMRHVTGKDGSGKRARIPVGAPGNALFISGGTFSIDAGSFLVLGAEGERRVATNIA